MTLFRRKGIPVRETGLMQEHFVVDKLFGRVKEWVYAHLTYRNSYRQSGLVTRNGQSNA